MLIVYYVRDFDFLDTFLRLLDLRELRVFCSTSTVCLRLRRLANTAANLVSLTRSVTVSW